MGLKRLEDALNPIPAKDNKAPESATQGLIRNSTGSPLFKKTALGC